MTTISPRKLTAEELAAFGHELDEIRDQVKQDLGERDVRHIRRIITLVHQTDAAGRFLLQAGVDPVTFALGSLTLGVSKILENMEVGHNVMHGQYDWTGDPELASSAYDWDHPCSAKDWKEYHNFTHHTYTNILGKDRDVGYDFFRVTPQQKWYPYHLIQPLGVAWLAFNFEWGVAVHNHGWAEALRGEKSWRQCLSDSKDFVRKAAWQVGKDYFFYPLLALTAAPRVLAGNYVANTLRDIWTFSIIWCGHFPEGVSFFTAEEAADESRGAWYLRQALGSANIEGNRLFYVMTGHLSHQIEHHLFPDIPASRYPEMAPQVRAILAKYGQPYNTGSLWKQLGSTLKAVLVNSLPPV
jgi:linoleoyl-CoA desaturase